MEDLALLQLYDVPLVNQPFQVEMPSKNKFQFLIPVSCQIDTSQRTFLCKDNMCIKHFYIFSDFPDTSKISKQDAIGVTIVLLIQQ
jgi:hypothetical protein